MADHPPVSILLPTTSWTDACGELAAQLKDYDELLIIHDVEDDPVTERQHTPEGIQLSAAGEPGCCSGIGQRHHRDMYRDGEVATP